MKKLLFALVMLGTAVAFSSCEKERNDIKNPEEQTIKVIAKQDANSTRVALNGLNGLWETNDAIGIFIDAASVKNVKLTTVDSGSTATFTGTLSTPISAGSKMYAYYPHGTLDNSAATRTSTTARVLVPIQQYPTLTSFDPLAAILYSAETDIEVNAGAVEPVSTTFDYAVAVAKFIFDDVTVETDNEPITSFKITTRNNIAGRVELDLQTGVFGDWFSSAAYTSKSIEAVYNVSDGLVLDGTNAIYICLVPTTLNAPVTIEAETENYIISKTINFSAGSGTTFTKGTMKTVTISNPTVAEKGDPFYAAWNFYGVNPAVAAMNNSPCTISPTIVGSISIDENLKAYNFGIPGTPAARTWGGSGFNTNTSINTTTTNIYATVKIQSTTKSISITKISGNIRMSSFGPTNTAVFYQLGTGAFIAGGDFANDGDNETGAAGNAFELNLRGVTGLQNIPANTVVTIKFVPHTSLNAGGTWYLNGNTNSMVSLKIEGMEY